MRRLTAGEDDVVGESVFRERREGGRELVEVGWDQDRREDWMKGGREGEGERENSNYCLLVTKGANELKP